MRGDEAVFEVVVEENAYSSWVDAVVAGCQHVATKTKSELVAPRMNNLIAHNKLQWYRMSDTAVIVTCPMQGDPNGCVTTQGVRCSGAAYCFLIRNPASYLCVLQR